ncbi:hypothetical protein HDU91_005316 [Kappamyces sp. JEL0680]|nr:hypothetical protein HDU91_005316 [Kappamyces sp. JEL0680]
MLVVGNNRYVYDISKWITSHPGGQIILHNVNGTDITNDYFHEAGFDASEFTPMPHPPPKKADVQGAKAVPGLSRADIISVRRQSIDSLQSRAAGITALNFTQDDWSAIQRSRRTHVHTRLAVQRLASLVVGELVSYQGNNRGSFETLASEEASFDPFEFRRYALTKHEIESPSGASKAFVRLRFCSLYPYDTRLDQPSQFIPGQCVEIQVRLHTGERISRYYTPICGDMNAMEIMVKIKPGGPMSEYLFKSQKGERQFKIRGPFGTPLLPSMRNYFTQEFYESIYFFAGGSGITPYLQLANHLMLSTQNVLKVVVPYHASLTDELNLSVGDNVKPEHHYLDGWCYGTNLTTGLTGTFPVGCVVPMAPTRLVLFCVSDLDADIMGSSVIEGAKLAYPQLIDVYRFNSKTLTPYNVRPLLDDRIQNHLVVVCGPDQMNSHVSDMLFQFGGNWTDNCRILSGDRPN